MNTLKMVMTLLFSLPSSHVEMEPPSISKIPSTYFPPLRSTRRREYHIPPAHVNYTKNQSVFGAILRGESPTLTLLESESLLSFEDIAPRAPLHALVIPKEYIESVFAVRQNDLTLLNEMHMMATDLIQRYYPDAYENKDYILCYHIPPFNSVSHLHLHVLAPASKMHWIYRFGKYLIGTRWCIEESEIRDRLQAGKFPVPFERWGC
jgi:diadenosine tetraphosphate (Ap4A) HIT family hydrolase